MRKSSSGSRRRDCSSTPRTAARKEKNTKEKKDDKAEKDYDVAERKMRVAVSECAIMGAYLYASDKDLKNEIAELRDLVATLQAEKVGGFGPNTISDMHNTSSPNHKNSR